MYRNELSGMSARNGVPLVVMKHGGKTVVGKRPYQRDQKQVSRIVDENRVQNQQEMLQSVNEGASEPVSEQTLKRACNMHLKQVTSQEGIAPST